MANKIFDQFFPRTRYHLTRNQVTMLAICMARLSFCMKKALDLLSQADVEFTKR